MVVFIFFLLLYIFSFLFKKNSYFKIYTKLSSKEFKIISTLSGAHDIVFNTLLVLLRHYTIQIPCITLLVQPLLTLISKATGA